MTRLQLSGGVVIHTEASLDEIREALQTALRESRLLELENPEGEVVVVNPVQIQVLETVANGKSADRAAAQSAVPAA